jgi:PAS domain S-box-containing protein
MLILEDPGGEPLERLLGQPMELSRFLRLAVGLAPALGKLHERRLIHKDIKPANILVDVAGGGVWLTGLGIASPLPRERQSPEPPEVIAGTLAYMAPEQTGRMNRSIDSRSDLYSLGVTFYQMLTGALPFKASDPMEWVHCHIARQPIPPAEQAKEIPAPLSAIVMKLLAKTAEERYQTAGGVARDLRRCLKEWEAHCHIEPFQLGTQDASDQLMIPEKLYGREHEIDALLASFDRVLANGIPELVLVSGYSGIGKSSVVHELHKALVPARGLFASGKFDQYKRDIPYATLAQAFQSLVRPLLGQSEAELGWWRDVLHEALGPNGQLIVNLVPDLELVIGKQPPVPDLRPQDAQNRFQVVFRRFLGVFARKEHPLTLFLDDLQWLDRATLDLLEHLVTHPEVRHLLLVGAYRDNEVGPAHPLLRTLEAIRKAGAKVNEIVLAPLGIDDVGRLVADALHCKPEHARPLAQLVHEKTGGNPFFAIQFFTTLAEGGLLAFDLYAPAWQWDIKHIRAKSYTDNVVDLMAGKLKRFAAITQEALKQLACLGNVAEIATLALVHGETEEAMHAALWEAVRAGLVLRLGASYKFLHDRVQEAAYALIPQELRAQHHLRIGRLLIAKMAPDQITEHLFNIVNQLNSGLAIISDADEKVRVAELNLKAGRKAKASTAYASACTYLSAGMSLIGSDGLDSPSQYGLAFALCLESAECEYLNGDFGKTEGLIAELLSRANSKIDKAAAYRVRVLLQMIKAEYREAINTGLECLRLFDVQIPAHPTLEQVHIEYEKLWQNLSERSIESLIDLPLMTDPEMQVVMTMLSELSAPAASASSSDSNLFYLVVYQMVIASLRYGTTAASVHAYADLALISGPVFHRYREGYRFAKLARSCFDKYGASEAKAYLCMEQVSLWTKPIATAIDFVRRAFRICIDRHDLTYACYCCNHLVTDLLLQGVDLEEVWRASQKGLEFVRKVKSRDTADVIVSQQRFILDMRGQTAVFSSFSDAQFDEELFEAQLTEERMPHLVCYYWILKLQARFTSGNFDAAMAAAQKAKQMLWSAEMLIESTNYFFYSALTIAAVHETTGSTGQPDGLEVIKQSLERFREWSASCPETFLDKCILISAEIARIEYRDLEAMRLYERAIQAARENGFVHNEALANELAARFYAARGFEKIAHAYLRDAQYCYLRWGADGKVQQLEELYPHLREEEPVTGPTSTIGTSVEQLDLATVMKASQAVAREIVQENLVQTLMMIALEHAGAERGLLILPHGEELRIAAEARTGRDGVEVQLRQAPATSVELPEALLRYVTRTQQSVILDDASRRNLFSDDLYVLQKRPRSVLCLPLVKQTKLMGALYLENNLAPRVFTPKRLTMLELLVSQAAISLDLAQLHADLTQENSDRRKAEEALRASEERWRKLFENSSAGIALITPNGRYIAANLALQRMLGYTEQELQRLISLDVSHEEDRAASEAILAESVDGQRRDYRIEKRYRRKDDNVIWADVSSTLVPATGSTPAFFATVIVDITERKRAEEKLHQKEISLREAQNELAHVSRVTTMGELAASIAHEVNQPLAGMITNANASLRWLAGDSPNLAEAREAIRRIIRDGNRAGDVISRMRALFKKAPAAKGPVDLNELIQEVLTLAQTELQKNRISLRTQFANDLPTVIGDKIQLQQVVLNLVLNGIEAMSEVAEDPRELCVSSQKVTEIAGGTGKETIEGNALTDPESASVLIAVRDSGPGLDATELLRVFETFYTTKSQGMGLGLAISRSIIEAHHGRLWVTANLPRGAVFQFTLPIQADES